MLHPTDDLRIKELKPLIPPAILIDELSTTEANMKLVEQARQQAVQIIQGKDDRLLVIIGPCSIHDPVAALDYAEKLQVYAHKLSDDLHIIMRVYFEKPRTIVGWKGLINDPKLDGSFAINQGLKISRKLLLDIANLKLPTGTEFLDTIIPQFISDLISWGAIGARTTESQIHRELASGLSMPIGFKNGTDGNVQIAVDAIRAARHHHHFLGTTKHGTSAIVSTKGNHDCHVILRGSNHGPNHQAEHINKAVEALTKVSLPPYLMVDCSHGNSEKDHTRQVLVVDDICQQLSDGVTAICGVMIESNLKEGRQNLVQNETLVYGQSITDACISWEQTVPILEKLAKAVKQRRRKG